MKVKILIPTEVEITHVRIEVAVRYDEEDIPNDFPLRDGDMWKGTVEINTGKILDWPVGKSGDMYMKVCDEGSYYLLDAEGKEVLSIEGNYVPNNLIPGEFGDYIELNIDKNGIITNWPKRPSLEDFKINEED